MAPPGAKAVGFLLQYVLVLIFLSRLAHGGIVPEVLRRFVGARELLA